MEEQMHWVWICSGIRAQGERQGEAERRAERRRASHVSQLYSQAACSRPWGRWRWEEGRETVNGSKTFP